VTSSGPMATDRQGTRRAPAGGEDHRRLKVLAADEDHEALDALAHDLEAIGHDVVGEAVAVDEITDLVVQHDPDVSVVVVHDDLQHALQLVTETVTFASGPVMLVAEDPEPWFAAEAAERGIHAMSGKDVADIQAAIEIALRRHGELETLSEKVDQLEGALARRAVIERAKGILMERHGIDQLTAFEQLRQEARRRSMKVVSLAAEVVGDGGLNAAS
jgi:AmiR/NasT family two-component response regulator